MLAKRALKSRCATDCGHSFPVKQQTLDAFDFLVVAFLNVGYFYRRRGPGGPTQPEFYTLPAEFVRAHLDVTSTWEKVHLKPLRDQIAHFRDEAGFDQIARRLGVPPPTETFV